MAQDKKSKVDDINKLRKILDNPTDPNTKKLISEDEKALDSIRRRLAAEPSKTPRSDLLPHKHDSLEPRITIHTKAPSIPQPHTVLPEFQLVPHSLPAQPVSTPASLFANEDLYEVEKVDVLLPEFLEATPKKPQETETTIRHYEPQVLDQRLPEWQLVEETHPVEPPTQPLPHEEPTADNIPEFEPIDTHLTPEPVVKPVEWEPLPAKEKPVEAPVEFQPVMLPEPQPQKLSKKEERDIKKAEKQKQKEAKRQKKLELKKMKREARQKEREAKRVAKEQEKIQLIPEKKPLKQEPMTTVEPSQITVDMTAFQGIESIDRKTAELLYKNGYFSIENLRDATVDDLVQVRGIKRKLAKNIKKEVEQKTTRHPESEFVPMKNKISAKKPREEPEDITEWESYHIDESSEEPSFIPACTYKGYTLYKRETSRGSGRKTTVHFFSKDKPDVGDPAELPDGYSIAVNRKTGVPYLKKKK